MESIRGTFRAGHRLALATVATVLLACAANADAASLQLVGRFASPVYVTSDPGNPNRLFVVERGGKIELVTPTATTLFADLSPEVECSASCLGSERGLLSIALAPDFDSSGRLFVDYANGVDGTIHVAELRAAGASAPPSSYREVLTIPHPEDSNHNGGQLQFGPEGLLFVSTGDGGASQDKHENSQNLASPLGKLLRLDPNPSGVLPYTVPAGNPFASVPGDNPLIWSYGLRNPFRFSFDRLTGNLFIGDVGEAKYEEVDFAAAPGLGAGADYGWNCREGFEPGSPKPDPQCATPPAAGFVDPVFAYEHVGGNCAIIGGYVVRDPGLGSAYGRYLYADHCVGELRSLDTLGFASRGEGIGVGEPDSFGEDSCGRLYVVSGKEETVSRLVGAEPTVCPGVETVPLKPSFAGIRALRRNVQRGKKALITVYVSPCGQRKGEPIKLFRGRRHLATRHLDRACTARFRPRISHRVHFQAKVAADLSFEAASSRRLGIRAYRGHRGKRKHHR